MIEQSVESKSQPSPKNNQTTTSIKRTFQLGNSLGKLMVQVNYFGKYFFVIVTYASLLKINGSLQISYPTPYESKPIVLNLIQEINANDEVTRRLTNQLQIPVILSLNIEAQTNKKGEQQLFEGLLQIFDVGYFNHQNVSDDHNIDHKEQKSMQAHFDSPLQPHSDSSMQSSVQLIQSSLKTNHLVPILIQLRQCPQFYPVPK